MNLTTFKKFEHLVIGKPTYENMPFSNQSNKEQQT